MFRISILSIMLASSALFADQSIMAVGDHYDTGEAYHVGLTKVTHDGDYVEFLVSFGASCYANQDDALNNITANVTSFVAWLNEERVARNEGVISHYSYPINVWQLDNSIYDASGCGGTYQGTQTIKIIVNRPAYAAALETGLIQDFYNELHGVIAPYNTKTHDALFYNSAQIISVQKGLYEDTVDNLRIAAKIRAQERATKDFLATLGDDYNGQWYLIGADYREQHNAPYLGIGAGAAALPYPIPTAYLDLGPIELNVSGSFHFVYDLKKK